MMTLYLIASIGIGIMMTCDVFLLAHPLLSLKKYLVFFLSFSALFFIMNSFAYYPMLFVILAVNSILAVKFTGKFYSVFYVPLGYIVNCVSINIIGLAANMIWDVSVQEVPYPPAQRLYNGPELSFPLSGETAVSEIPYQHF